MFWILLNIDKPILERKITTDLKHFKIRIFNAFESKWRNGAIQRIRLHGYVKI